MLHTRLLLSVLVVLGLGAGTPAHAGGGKVDWSDYLEPPGAKQPVKKQATPEVVPQDSTSASASASRAPAKKRAAAESRAKAKRKAPARPKRKR